MIRVERSRLHTPCGANFRFAPPPFLCFSRLLWHCRTQYRSGNIGHATFARWPVPVRITLHKPLLHAIGFYCPSRACLQNPRAVTTAKVIAPGTVLPYRAAKPRDFAPSRGYGIGAKYQWPSTRDCFGGAKTGGVRSNVRRHVPRTRINRRSPDIRIAESYACVAKRLGSTQTRNVPDYVGPRTYRNGVRIALRRCAVTFRPVPAPLARLLTGTERMT